MHAHDLKLLYVDGLYKPENASYSTCSPKQRILRLYVACTTKRKTLFQGSMSQKMRTICNN